MGATPDVLAHSSYAAIVLGFSAKSDIRASGGMVGGGGLATAGIVMGFAGKVGDWWWLPTAPCFVGRWIIL